MSNRAHRPSRRSRRVALIVGVAGALTALGVSGATASSGPPPNGVSAWNFKQIHVTSHLQSAVNDGRGVTVAIVDTWVDSSNTAEFGGRVLAGADCANHGGQCVPGPAPHDDCGHGTHVAGTVGSKDWGVAPGVTLMPVRVLTDPDGNHPDACTGSTDDVAAGIRWADQHGAQVINLSLAAVKGVATASPVTAAVQKAVSDGGVVVFAAGNSDRPVADSYGGRALIVAATGPSGGLASYSQHGAGVSVAAPGGDPRGSTCASDGSDCVVSTWLHREYAALAGTSMAAPHVSGLAALLFAQHPGWSEAAVVQRIEATAHPLAGAGHGRVDAAAALGLSPNAGSASHPRATHAPTPRHTATAQARSRPAKHPATVKPRPRPTAARPTTPTAPLNTLPLNVAGPTAADDGSNMPLAPPVAAAVLLVALAAGLLRVRRRGRA
jgi:subtilisin family serine protease